MKMIRSQAIGDPVPLSNRDLELTLREALDPLPPAERVLVIPPDFTRFHSKAGLLTEMVWQYYGDKVTDILPALGTHAPMTPQEISAMFGETPTDLFRVHNWRKDVVSLGEVPESYISELTDGRIRFPWPAEVNRLLLEGDFDRIISIGQVVPHEVIGMANYNKNVFVGTGGSVGINRSHFISAVYGIERVLGRADNPVRAILNYASENFGKDLPITYVQTVIGVGNDGSPETRGIFIGDDSECFYHASESASRFNVFTVERPPQKVIAWMDPKEFKSTWLANKAVYRSRLAIADGGELVVIAPGLKEFGEDREIDALIRKYGYCGTDQVLDLVEREEDLKNMLSAAAHLIHGSSEGRFTITYAPGHLSEEEIQKVGYKYLELQEALRRYQPDNLKPGFNTLSDGEEVYFIPNPALGLWAHPSRFTQ